VAGYVGEAGGYTALVTVALDGLGRQKWFYRHDRGQYRGEKASCVAAGATGDVYVAGVACPTGWDGDFTVVSLSAAGDLRWTYHYDGPANGGDRADCVTVGNDGLVYAAGVREAVGADGVVVSVTPGVGKEEAGSQVPTLAFDLRTRPAPFAGSATISYTVSQTSPVTLAVFSVTGRLVRTLERGSRAAGPHSVHWDGLDGSGEPVSPGTYICRLVVADRPVATTMLLRAP
jgi:hypothetical protein